MEANLRKKDDIFVISKSVQINLRSVLTVGDGIQSGEEDINIGHREWQEQDVNTIKPGT